jgi:proteasome accessory factor B
MAESEYGTWQRMRQVRTLLETAEGVTVYQIAEQCSVSVRTAIRCLRALEQAGYPLMEEVRDRRKVWRVMPESVAKTRLRLSTSQTVTLHLACQVLGFLAGTGFKEDIDDVSSALAALLKQKHAGLSLDKLRLKLVDINEAPHLYQGRAEDVNEIVTALLREEKLEVTHGAVSERRKRFLLDPYTLLVYRKGLYLAGYSHHHEGVRTFSLDGFKDVRWKRGAAFDYPKDWNPAELFDGAFGLIAGPRTKVKVFFDARVARFVKRRRWHPTQRIDTADGGIILEMDVAGTVELKSWLLGFGNTAEVLAPDSLREEVAAELESAAARYRRRSGAAA